MLSKVASQTHTPRHTGRYREPSEVSERTAAWSAIRRDLFGRQLHTLKFGAFQLRQFIVPGQTDWAWSSAATNNRGAFPGNSTLAACACQRHPAALKQTVRCPRMQIEMFRVPAVFGSVV